MSKKKLTEVEVKIAEELLAVLRKYDVDVTTCSCCGLSVVGKDKVDIGEMGDTSLAEVLQHALSQDRQ